MPSERATPCDSDTPRDSDTPSLSPIDTPVIVERVCPTECASPSLTVWLSPQFSPSVCVLPSVCDVPSDTLVDREYLKGVSILTEGVETIGEMGGQLKDLSMGMVDFPSMFRGREVLLCWMPGEEKIGYWHDPEAGFAGRSAIEDENEFHGDSDEEPN